MSEAQDKEIDPKENPKESPQNATKKGKVKGHASKGHSDEKKPMEKSVELTEDCFGTYVDETGKKHKIQRFTWKNHNDIKVQVITYGARITSLVLPNRKGIPDDVVMGFDDLAGYLHYEDLYVGATLGRVADKIEKATFAINGKQFWLTPNNKPHHANGGFNGLDKVVWIPYVEGTRVLMSYMSPDLDEGYPGDLLIKINFELTSKNEFVVDMEAATTKPTILNLSNLLYFNLGGHGAGADELYRHVVNINSNCFTPIREDGLPTGEIMNVIYTKNDFQIPKLLKKEIGIVQDDGFDVHLCVNRALDQGVSFAARALHPPSGRVLEVYSNQYGIHFNTANNLNVAVKSVPVRKKEADAKCEQEPDTVFDLINRLHESVAETLSIDSKTNYTELKDLIRKLHKRKFSYGNNGIPAEIPTSPEGYPLEDKQSMLSGLSGIVLNPLQVKYLEAMMETSQKCNSLPTYTELETTIRRLLDSVTAKTELEMHTKRNGSREEVVKNESQLRAEEIQRDVEEKLGKEDSELSRKGMIRMRNNKIPSYYKDGRVHGKNNAIYKRHGFICFQTQNYPNAVYHTNFPNCELHPGETYKHKIVYKFWLQSGDPSKWLRRNCPPA